MNDPIREAIQRTILDKEGEGWSVTQYVIAMGLERMNPDGTVDSLAWYHSPPDQPAWQTSGLLDQAQDLHDKVSSDEDDFD